MKTFNVFSRYDTVAAAEDILADILLFSEPMRGQIPKSANKMMILRSLICNAPYGSGRLDRKNDFVKHVCKMA